MAMGQRKTQSGRKVDANQLSTLGQFTRSKLNPQVGILVDWMQEKNFIGEPFEWKNQGFEKFTPLFMQDMYDAAKEYGPAGALGASPAFFGVGVQTYKPKRKKLPSLPK